MTVFKKVEADPITRQVKPSVGHLHRRYMTGKSSPDLTSSPMNYDLRHWRDPAESVVVYK